MQRRGHIVAAVVGAAIAISTVAVLRYTDRAHDTQGPSSALSGPMKTVSFAGHQTRVPASWPVYDLRADPTRCVRFDQHAVYLGTPGADQNCPAHAVGRTEALLIEPAPPGGKRANAGTESGFLKTTFADSELVVTASYADSETGLELASSFVREPAATSPAPANSNATGTEGSTAGQSETATTPNGDPADPAPIPSPDGGSGTPDVTAPETTAPAGSDTSSSVPPMEDDGGSPEPSGQAPVPAPESPDAPLPTGSDPSDGVAPSLTATDSPTTEPTGTTASSDSPPASEPTASDPTEPIGPTGANGPTATTSGAVPSPSPDETPAPTPERTTTTWNAVLAPARVPTPLIRRGLGFDTCAAPSLSAMAAWRPTTLDTVGVYIGGVNRACPDGNLSASWVRTVSGYGYTFTPIYVGLQAPCTTFSRRINPGQAYSQGVAAASDAVAGLRRLGFGTHNTVFLDIEYFESPAGDSTCGTAVLNYQTGWITRLHQLSYTAGVYTASPALRDLVAVIPTQTTPSAFGIPDVLWLARWNNTADVDFTPHAPNSLWMHRRLKQYTGGHSETHAGVTLNIDSNYVDGAIARPGNY